MLTVPGWEEPTSSRSGCKRGLNSQLESGGIKLKLAAEEGKEERWNRRTYVPSLSLNLNVTTATKSSF